MRCCRVRYSDNVQLQKASITVNYESIYRQKFYYIYRPNRAFEMLTFGKKIQNILNHMNHGKKKKNKIGMVDDSKSNAQLANWCLFQIAKL